MIAGHHAEHGVRISSPPGDRSSTPALHRHGRHVRDLLPRPQTRRCHRRRPGRPLRRQERGAGADPQHGGPARLHRSSLRAVRPIRERPRGRPGLQLRHRNRALPGAVLRLLVPDPAAGLAGPGLANTRDRVARRWCGLHLAHHRRRHRHRLGTQTRFGAGPITHVGGARGCVAADLLHRPAVAVDLQLRPRLDPAGRHQPTRRDEPVVVGVRPDPPVGDAGLPVRRGVRATHPGRHARDDERGLRPDRPRQGPHRADRGAASTACGRR